MIGVEKTFSLTIFIRLLFIIDKVLKTYEKLQLKEHNMRIITLLMTTLAISPAHAKIFKCEIDGKTSFQQTPCQAQANSSEFLLKKDISIDRQQQAMRKLNDDLSEIANKKKLAKEIADKERAIRANENNARATYQNAQANKEQAIQAAKQTKALRERNSLLLNPYPYRAHKPLEKLSNSLNVKK
ncbi:MAG: hypothetical protein methR_P1944 [Methyloprofundus sp.]|nr:MAG: hypothetical protein methR_P1944 [Methyloprofundus sp.]